VHRWLDQDAIKPWQHRSWIFIRDPDLCPKAARVLGLYARRWGGVPLRADEYVVSADEKTSIQARCRCHLTPRPRASPRHAREPHLGCGGALASLTAHNVHRAKVFGRTEPPAGIDPFTSLVAQVMSQEPCSSAKRVFRIGDPLLHRAAQGRLTQRLHRPRPDQGPASSLRRPLHATAQPFQWQFTTSDLHDLLARLDRHTADHSEESSVVLAA
jgi:hypothetical protein